MTDCEIPGTWYVGWCLQRYTEDAIRVVEFHVVVGCLIAGYWIKGTTCFVEARPNRKQPFCHVAFWCHLICLGGYRQLHPITAPPPFARCSWQHIYCRMYDRPACVKVSRLCLFLLFRLVLGSLVKSGLRGGGVRNGPRS